MIRFTSRRSKAGVIAAASAAAVGALVLSQAGTVHGTGGQPPQHQRLAAYTAPGGEALAADPPPSYNSALSGLSVSCTGGADSPHYSRHAGQQGQDIINTKFWTQCGGTVAAITAIGQLQEQIAGVWIPVAFTDPAVETHANTNYTYSTASTACTAGTFRGAGFHSATDYDGNTGVAVTTSNQVTSPCP
jgi:hypothetical protein